MHSTRAFLMLSWIWEIWFNAVLAISISHLYFSCKTTICCITESGYYFNLCCCFSGKQQLPSLVFKCFHQLSVCGDNQFSTCSQWTRKNLVYRKDLHYLTFAGLKITCFCWCGYWVGSDGHVITRELWGVCWCHKCRDQSCLQMLKGYLSILKWKILK